MKKYKYLVKYCYLGANNRYYFKECIIYADYYEEAIMITESLLNCSVLELNEIK